MLLPRFASILALMTLAAPGFLPTAAWAAPRPLPAKPASPSAAASADELMRQAQEANAKGDQDLAFRLAQAAIVADPAKPQTYDLLGDLYAHAGEGDFASFYYSEALGIDPSDPAAAKGTAELSHNSNQRAAEATPTVQ